MQRRSTLRRFLPIPLSILFLFGLVGVWATHHQVGKAHAAVSGFVTRSGSQLKLNGSTFRAAGPNEFYLLLDENIGSGTCYAYDQAEPCDYPSQYRVNDALDTAKEMGATVVRSQSMGVSFGCPLCIEPTLNTFNDEAFRHDDYAIKAASDRGLRLIIPLMDNYRFFVGGEHTFTDWEGITTASDTTRLGEFYTNTTVISDFENYINHFLNHVNTLTGVAYKDDPTIMMWSTNNEAYPPVSWSRTISDYIHSLDSNHLIGDGYRGVNTDDLSLPNIDVIEDHDYPMGVSYTHNNVATVTAANKVYYIGEYDWNSHDTGGDTLANFLTEIEGDGTAIDSFWDLWPHNDTYGYRHTGGYDGNYPGDSTDMQTKMQQLRAHAYKLQGITTLPTDATPTAPLITSLSGTSLAWRGATLGQTYSVERSADGVNNWSVICNQCATDYQTPWTDSTQPSGPVYYRVRGYNHVNQPGPYSAVYPTPSSSNSSDLAAGKTVTTSSTVSWTNSYSGSNLTDQNNADFWTSQLLSSSTANEWAYVDLGSQQSFSRVELSPRVVDGVVKAFPSSFTIQGSNDPNGTWTTLDTETSFTTPSPDAAASIWVGAQSYRYVRINVTTANSDGSNYYVQLAELEVYNTPLSANKSVTTSSTVSWTSSYGGSNLTNGSNTDFWTSQVSGSSVVAEWAYVDLGSQQSFSRVELYPRTSSGAVNAFPATFALQGTNDPSGTWTTFDTETNFTTPSAHAAASIWVGAQSYRYVRVNVTAANSDGSNYYVQLAEIEVH